jgi:hypothetical protein
LALQVTALAVGVLVAVTVDWRAAVLVICAAAFAMGAVLEHAAGEIVPVRMPPAPGPANTTTED